MDIILVQALNLILCDSKRPRCIIVLSRAGLHYHWSKWNAFRGFWADARYSQIYYGHPCNVSRHQYNGHIWLALCRIIAAGAPCITNYLASDLSGNRMLINYRYKLAGCLEWYDWYAIIFMSPGSELQFASWTSVMNSIADYISRLDNVPIRSGRL